MFHSPLVYDRFERASVMAILMLIINAEIGLVLYFLLPQVVYFNIAMFTLTVLYMWYMACNALYRYQQRKRNHNSDNDNSADTR